MMFECYEVRRPIPRMSVSAARPQPAFGASEMRDGFPDVAALAPRSSGLRNAAGPLEPDMTKGA
jgi:hypothetical protein